jgi:hypothetical protein
MQTGRHLSDRLLWHLSFSTDAGDVRLSGLRQRRVLLQRQL